MEAHVITWLRELEDRVERGLPRDNRAMMVALRRSLPRAFRPSDLPSGLIHGDMATVEGLLAIGDPGRLIPDLDRLICYVRDRLIDNPHLEQVTAGDVADSLGVPDERAERLLRLASSLGDFMAGASSSAAGYATMFVNRDDVLAEYLGYDSVEGTLARRSEQRTARTHPVLQHPGGRLQSPMSARNSVFIVMSMDPQDHSLVDVHRTIQDVCAAFSLTASRIDDIEHQDRITDRILEQIAAAEFIVADLSGERPNVYYEVGYAHALGKRPILLRKKGTRLHFDLSVHNVPEYQNITALRELLSRRFQAILGRSPGGGTV